MSKPLPLSLWNDELIVRRGYRKVFNRRTSQTSVSTRVKMPQAMDIGREGVMEVMAEVRTTQKQTRPKRQFTSDEGPVWDPTKNPHMGYKARQRAMLECLSNLQFPEPKKPDGAEPSDK